MKKKHLFIIVCILCFLYLGGKLTFTSFESLIDGFVHNSIAGISIHINGEDVLTSGGSLDRRIILDNTTWVSTHTREEKLSPGSSGTIDLEVDPAGSEVAILYEFQFVDKLIDNDKLINFDNITSDSQFVRTGVDTYSGIITLADLNQNRKVNISVDFYFDYLEDIEGIEEDTQNLDDLFEIHFHAIQYTGEELVPYVPNVSGYVYSVNTNTVYYGDLASTIGTYYQTPTSAASNFSKNVFLRHNIENGLVSSSSVAFIKNGTIYYLQASGATIDPIMGTPAEDSIYYASNKQVLDTAFGSNNCTETSEPLSYSCSEGTLRAAAYAYGNVSSFDNSWNCIIVNTGASYCDS